MTEHLCPTELSVDKTSKPRDGANSPFGRTRHTLPDLVSSFTAGRVSVIIPCFNSEEFVGEAIRSALDQTWSNIEVIVIDDGSKDGSRQVIESYGDQITTLWLNHGGAAAARNAGLEVAAGEFIQFLDADDVLLSDAIKRRALAFDGEADAVFGDLEFFDHHDQSTIRTTSHIDWPHPSLLARLIRYNLYTEAPLHRRNVVYSIGGFDEGLPCSQEVNLHLRLSLAGADFRYLPGTVARARVHQSPGRIENTPWYIDRPDLHLEIIEHHHRLIAEHDRASLTSDVREAFAFKLWSRGMIAGRNGAFTVSRRYFKCAREYASPLQPGGSAVFRTVHALFGPTATAWMLYQQQRLAKIVGRDLKG